MGDRSTLAPLFLLARVAFTLTFYTGAEASVLNVSQRVDDRWQWAVRKERSSARQQSVTRGGGGSGPLQDPVADRRGPAKRAASGARSALSPGRALLKRPWLRGGVRPSSSLRCLLSPGSRPGGAPPTARTHCGTSVSPGSGGGCEYMSLRPLSGGARCRGSLQGGLQTGARA